MGKKLYIQQENGAIVVKNARKAWGVDTPSYCYDIWMPLIGLRPISVWGLLWRLARDGETSGIGLKRLAAKARMGEKAFADDVKLLHELKWLIFTPSQRDPYTGEWAAPCFEILDPPDAVNPELIKKYAPPSGYEPLTKWLVERSPNTAKVASNGDRGVALFDATPASDDDSPASDDDSPAPDEGSILEPSVESSFAPLIESSTPSFAGASADSENRPNIFAFFEENIGPLTRNITDKLKLAVEDYTENWVRRAIEIADDNAKRNWAYIEAILRRWKTEGYDGDKYAKTSEGQSTKPNSKQGSSWSAHSDNGANDYLKTPEGQRRRLLGMIFGPISNVNERLAELGLAPDCSIEALQAALEQQQIS